MTEWEGRAQPTRHSPTTSTVYKYKLDLALVNSATSVPTNVVTKTRPSRRRRGSACSGVRGDVSRRSDGEGEGADRDVVGRAQVSSAAPAGPARAEWPTVKANINYYKRPDLDMPHADFRNF